MLDKTFSPKAFEAHLYAQTLPIFTTCIDTARDPYTIMMPPPNVTGSLHLGHALTYTLQDILIRFSRMQDKDVLWQAGTDHAGIATQMVVERQLAEQKTTRHELGRAEFLKRVWAWKEESGNTIVEQQRRLGVSPDWQRSRFTMDEGLSKAVAKVFVQLFNEGLIYRDDGLVNWDPKLKTAISDLEVLVKEEPGFLWHIHYPSVNENEPGIVVATTRPETLFGDVAVAVHPDDERYQSLIGTYVRLPLTDQEIPIIADTYCDPTKGTGAVKITPAHDFNDRQVAQRNGDLALNVDILDEDACLKSCLGRVPESYKGLSVLEARQSVLADLDEKGLLVKAEPRLNTVQYGDRSGVMVQPRLMKQWYVNAKVLAEPALKAVEEGKTRFVPESYVNTYFEWMRNIQPWCISRQIWWGHQIPAWYGPDGSVFVAENESEAIKQAQKVHGNSVTLTRETDVLDTWFSSALWPFSTLGWPDETADLKRYYPTNVLITGADIIFFWVARMMMMGLHFMKEVPFSTVYLHTLVRDEKGQKMSKSKGNIIDPLVLIDKYGADALRFCLASSAAPGNDIRLGEAKVEGYRNFITKLWNAARFLEMNDCRLVSTFDPFSAQLSLNQWIVKELVETEKRVRESLENYRFDYAAQHLYHFLWGTFCDVYVECLKPCLAETVSENHRQETRATAAWVLREFLKLAHPFMPFVTEHLWQAFTGQENDPLVTTAWPTYTVKETDTKPVVGLLTFVEEIRSLKGLLGIPAGNRLDVSTDNASFLGQNWHWAAHLGRLGNLCSAKIGIVLPIVVNDITYSLHLPADIAVDEMVTVLGKKLSTLNDEISYLEKKCQNLSYKTAKPDQWQTDSVLHQTKHVEIEKIKAVLVELTEAKE